jgi:mRNA-degrading endonuclease YafQ of YafQ-DinJ toxin-antitoxin module
MRKIITTKTFDKSFLKISRRNNTLQQEIIECIKLLSLDINDIKLKTHKLSGNLKYFYSARVNFSIRIIFKYDDESVYLETVGSHDDVY